VCPSRGQLNSGAAPLMGMIKTALIKESRSSAGDQRRGDRSAWGLCDESGSLAASSSSAERFPLQPAAATGPQPAQASAVCPSRGQLNSGAAPLMGMIKTALIKESRSSAGDLRRGDRSAWGLCDESGGLSDVYSPWMAAPVGSSSSHGESRYARNEGRSAPAASSEETQQALLMQIHDLQVQLHGWKDRESRVRQEVVAQHTDKAQQQPIAQGQQEQGLHVKMQKQQPTQPIRAMPLPSQTLLADREFPGGAQSSQSAFGKEHAPCLRPQHDSNHTSSRIDPIRFQ